MVCDGVRRYGFGQEEWLRREAVWRVDDRA